MGPKAVQNEEQLDKYAAERQNSAHDHAGQRFGVQTLRWYLTRYLIRPHGVFNGPFLETKIGSNEGQRNADAKPQSQNCQQRRERYRAGRSFSPQDQIANEKYSEQDPRDQKTRHQNIRFPTQTAEHFVNPG